MVVNIDKYYYTSKKEASEYMGMMSNVVGNNIVLSGKLNDVPSGRLFRADFGFLQMCQSL